MSRTGSRNENNTTTGLIGLGPSVRKTLGIDREDLTPARATRPEQFDQARAERT